MNYTQKKTVNFFGVLFLVNIVKRERFHPADIYLFKFHNRSSRERCDIYSKLAIITLFYAQ